MRAARGSRSSAGSVSTCCSGRTPSPPPSRAARAPTRWRTTRETLLERNTIDARRLAIQELEEAVRLAPSNVEHTRVLANAYLKAGFLKSSKGMFQRVRVLEPKDAEAHTGLGEVARRDWIKTLDRASLIEAIQQFDAAIRSRPDYARPWIGVAPLLIELPDYEAALRAGEGACRAAPNQPEAVARARDRPVPPRPAGRREPATSSPRSPACRGSRASASRTSARSRPSKTR